MLLATAPVDHGTSGPRRPAGSDRGVNLDRRRKTAEIATRMLGGSVSGKTVAVFGSELPAWEFRSQVGSLGGA